MIKNKNFERDDWTDGLSTMSSNALKNHGFTSKQEVIDAFNENLIYIKPNGGGSTVYSLGKIGIVEVRMWLGIGLLPNKKKNNFEIIKDYAIWQAITDLESRCRHRSSGLQIEIEDKEHEPVVQAALLVLGECGVDVVRDAKFPNIKINYDRSQNKFFGRA